MAHIVKTALVVPTDTDGKHRYLYRGAQVPADIPAAEVKRLADEGFIVDTEAPAPVVEDEVVEDEAPARRGRGRS